MTTGTGALLALFASFAQSLGGFCMQSVAKMSSSPMQANLSGIFVVWSTIGIVALIGIVVQSICVGPLAGIVDRQNICIALVAGILNCCGMFLLVMALAIDPDSAGPITAMMPFSSIEAAIIAWVILHETLAPRQIVGIAICVWGPVLMALAGPSKTQLQGLAGGGLAALCMGFHAYSRRLAKSRGAEPWPVLLLICLVAGCAGALGTAMSFMVGRGLAGLSQMTMLIAVCSALSWVCGNALFQKALEGPVGPADAILNTNSVGTALLGVAVWHIQLAPLTVIGMLCCIGGIATMFLSKPKAVAAAAAAAEGEANHYTALE